MGGEVSTVSAKSPSSKMDHKDSRLDFFLSKVSKGQPSSEIFKDTFVDQFPSYTQDLAQKYFDHMTHSSVNPEHSSSQSTKIISQQQCYEALQRMQSLTSTESQLKFYISVFCGRDGISETDIYSMIESAFIISMISNGIIHRWTESEQNVVKGLARTMASKGSQSAICSWMDRNCPELISKMHLVFLNNIYRGKEEIPSTDLVDIGAVFEGHLLTMTQWWLLTSALPSCFTQPQGQRSSGQVVDGASVNGVSYEEATVWNILYSSQDHGLSLNRFKHHAFGYRGPTVLLLACDGGYVYAAAVDVEWRESLQPWGGANCHIFSLSPNFQILEDGNNMLVFNEKSRQIPKGVWIGRDSKNRKLHIGEGFDTVTHNFQTSKITCIEVWGCGDSSIKAAQSNLKKAELKDAAKNAKVKLPGQWDENPDKMLLEWGGVKVNHAEYAHDART